MSLAYKNNERNQRETNSGFSINSKSVIRRLSCRDAACRVLEGRGTTDGFVMQDYLTTIFFPLRM